MKKFFYIVFISFTIISSFGFRGCDQAYCEFLYNLNSAVGRFSSEEDDVLFAVGDEGIYESDSLLCLATLIGGDYILEYIAFISAGLENGLNFYCSVGDSGLVVWSPDGGNTWEDRSIAGLTANLYGLDFLNYGANGMHAVVCGESGTIYKSTNSGSSFIWEKVNTITTERLNSIGAITSGLYIAVGEKGTIIRTSDGGQTWVDFDIADTSAHFNRIFLGESVAAFDRAWAVADNGKIYATVNYGNNWFLQNSGVTTDLYDVIFRNGNDGVVVGAAGVVRYTTNGGSTWLEDTYFNGLTDGDIISITGVDPNTATALIRGGTDNPGGTTLLTVSSEPLSAHDNINIIPSEYSLEQNYPNPFNPNTVINWQLPVGGQVRLVVIDILGREVAELVNEYKPAGSYEVEFTATDLTSGIYFYQLKVGNEFSETKKLVLMK